MSKKLLSLAALALLFTAPAFAEELSAESLSSETNVTTPDITTRGVPAIIAIQPNRSVTTSTTTTYTTEDQASVNHYRGYHGRDIVFSDETVSPTVISRSTTTITNGDAMDEIPGVMSLEDEANLAASTPAFAE